MSLSSGVNANMHFVMDPLPAKNVPARRPVSKPRRIVVVASYTRSLKTFRFDLLRGMVELGHEVHALAPEDDAETIAALDSIGVTFETIPMARASLTPFGDLHTLLALRRALARIRPDVLLTYTMKPIIYGLIAGRMAGITERHALVTGLGWAFGDYDVTPRRKLVRRVSLWLYRSAFKGTLRIFVYNEADAEDILGPGLVDEPWRVQRVPGSGINLERFPVSPLPEGPPVFLMIARLLREKGVLDFVEAARRLKSDYPLVRFVLVGPFDPNPTGLTPDEVASWVHDGIVEYPGETHNVRPYLNGCHVFVLPSYYREGVPRTLLEALATGRAVVTTDMPGCRDAVEDGVNGFLVPPRDPQAIADALGHFADDPGLAQTMSSASRDLAARRFNVERVNDILLEQMNLMAPRADAPPHIAKVKERPR